MAQQNMGGIRIQRQIDYPFIPSIKNFDSYEGVTTGLEGHSNSTGRIPK